MDLRRVDYREGKGKLAGKKENMKLVADQAQDFENFQPKLFIYGPNGPATYL
jgi:hypothetical protein